MRSIRRVHLLFLSCGRAIAIDLAAGRYSGSAAGARGSGATHAPVRLSRSVGLHYSRPSGSRTSLKRGRRRFP